MTNEEYRRQAKQRYQIYEKRYRDHAVTIYLNQPCEVNYDQFMGRQMIVSEEDYGYEILINPVYFKAMVPWSPIRFKDLPDIEAVYYNAELLPFRIYQTDNFQVNSNGCYDKEQTFCLYFLPTGIIVDQSFLNMMDKIG